MIQKNDGLYGAVVRRSDSLSTIVSQTLESGQGCEYEDLRIKAK